MGVDSGHHVVKHHPITPFYHSFDEVDRWRLYDIKGTKEKKSNEDIRPCGRHGDHGNAKPYYLVDHDALAVLLLKDMFRLPGCPAGNQTNTQDTSDIAIQGQKPEEQKKGDSGNGPDCTRSYRAKPHAPPCRE
jgi:hypothetical protein